MATGNDILAMKRAGEEAKPIERTTCPKCEWVLEKHPDGRKHCPFCGYILNGGIGEQLL